MNHDLRHTGTSSRVEERHLLSGIPGDIEFLDSSLSAALEMVAGHDMIVS